MLNELINEAQTHTKVLDLHHAGPFFTLAIIIIVGMSCGFITKRLRLPSMTGQIIGGIIIGRAGFDLFGVEPLHSLAPITDFAMGLIAVTIGGHLTWHRLRNAGHRLVLLFLCEAIVTPLIVLTVFLILGLPWTHGFLFAAVAIATAPATIVALVKETRARGTFVKTLIAAVALNNLACIIMFEIARVFAATRAEGSTFANGLSRAALGLFAAILIGASIGVAMHLVAARTLGRERLATAATISLLLAVGLANFLAISPLLTCLSLGFVQTNLTPEKTRLLDSMFEDFEPGILAVFFTLAGMHIVLDQASIVVTLALLYFLTRLLGKLLSARLAMKLARSTKAIRRYLGPALIPQAGVAVGLVVILQEDPTFASISGLFGAVVLMAVTINELVGPVMTRWSLAKSGDIGQDRSRLLDFLQEENIITNLNAANMAEAIERLVALLVRSHRLIKVDEKELRKMVMMREAEVSTCIGGGLAIPHGELAGCKQMYGVMGLSSKGMAIETPDGEPIHCIVLLATPPDQRRRHLEVLAAIAQTIGFDPEIKQRLFHAKSPAHAHEILHDSDALSFNYYLDEENDQAMASNHAS
ncbi:MAG: PTS sugar transporter subunit IIA [Deltaproteobacteria bacterium]|nr:PTS sugar transporter subunit IIA [Deltaproteobacteria bacterium]